MERSEQAGKIALAMWGGEKDSPLPDRDWNWIMGRLHLLLAQLIDQHDQNPFVFGDTAHYSGTKITALLVTETHIYYADFDIVEQSDGWEVDGSYNLQIASRAQLTGITVDEIGTSANGMADDVLRTNYTIHTQNFPITIPIGGKAPENRNKLGEIDLLEALHHDLA